MVKDANLFILYLRGLVLAERVIKSKAGQWAYDCSALPSGTYFCQLLEGEGRVSTTKLIVTH